MSKDVNIKTCRATLKKMRTILNSMEEQSGACPEIRALRQQIRVVSRCCTLMSKSPDKGVHPDADPKAEAEQLVKNIPLDEIFQHEELANRFLSELLLAISSAKGDSIRREQQKEGIRAAIAKGVHFGKRRLSLPENFDDIRHAWRNGECSLRDAAGLCGMPRSTFRSIVLRMEQEEQETQQGTAAQTA